MKSPLGERTAHTAPESLRPTVGPLCLCPCWPLGPVKTGLTAAVTTAGPLLGQLYVLEKEVASAHSPASVVRGEGWGPALCVHPHGVKHPPSAAVQNALKSHFQSRLSARKPPDGGTWPWKSFTLSHRFILCQEPPAVQAQPTPVDSGSRLPLQSPLSYILEDVNVRCSIKI